MQFPEWCESPARCDLIKSEGELAMLLPCGCGFEKPSLFEWALWEGGYVGEVIQMWPGLVP